MFRFFEKNKKRRSLSASYGRPDSKKIHDVFFAPERQTVSLRRREAKIEIDLWKIRQFILFHRYAFLSLGSFLVLTTALAFSFISHADTALFYPDSCLGGWQNPEQAAGKPDLNSSSAISDFNTKNSAFLLNKISQIFCGEFQGDIPEKSQLKKATLHILLAIAPKETFSLENSEEELPVGQATTSDSLDNKELEIIFEDKVLEVQKASSTPAGSFDLGTETTTTSEDADVSVEEQGNLENEAGQALEENATSTEDFPGEQGGIGEEESEPAAPEEVQEQPADSNEASEETTPPSGEENPESPEVSLMRFFGVNYVFASDDVSGDTSNFGLSSTTKDTAASSSPVSALASSTPDREIAPSQNDEDSLEVPSSESLPLGQAEVKVLFSFDGENWQPIGVISTGDVGPEFSFSVPINRWEDIAKMQIRLETPSVAPAEVIYYFDGLRLEASYERETSSEETIAEEITKEEKKKTENYKPTLRIFDSSARQSCLIEPFSQSLERGETVNYQVNLVPGAVDASYELVLGDTPEGVSASFDPYPVATAASVPLSVTASSSAQTGSFNIVLVYREKRISQESIPNFCKFNLIIK